MNHGKFFSLNLSASRIEKGIIVFDYTDIFDPTVIENYDQTPRYPIFVTITSGSVKFILQYCVELLDPTQPKEEQKFASSSMCECASNLRHMEEVLIELPLITTSDLSLASILKRLYITPFPIELKKEKNYILELIRNRYKSNREDSPYQLKHSEDHNQTNIHYSSLPIWELYDIKEQGYKLYNKEEKYNKVLRKLVLDFFFDMMHSDVFENSVHYDKMYKQLMSDYFCSSIIHKSEFYYQRALVNNLLNTTLSLSDTVSIYAANLDRAEQKWIECIQSPESDVHFEFQPNWFEDSHKVGGNFRDVIRKVFSKSKISEAISYIEKKVRNVLLLHPTTKFKIYESWFTTPEEELLRVYHRDDNECERISNSKDLYTIIQKNDDVLTKDVSFDKTNLNQRISTSSKWLLRRYNIPAAYGLSFCFGANTFVISLLMTFVAGICEIQVLWYIFLSITIVIASVLLVKLIVRLFSCIRRMITRGINLNIPRKRERLNLLFPRLIASITAAWFTIALSEDVYKAFFDIPFSKISIWCLLIFIFLFVFYEVNKIVPKITWWKKIFRAAEMMIISFTISLFVGICVINFTGDRMLVRSGVLPQFYRNNVLVRTNSQLTGEPAYVLNFDSLSKSKEWNDSIVMNVYTFAPNEYLDSVSSLSAVHQFAQSPYNDVYMSRIDSIYANLDTLSLADSTIAISDSIIRARFLIRHENNELFKDLLPYVEHSDGHPIAKIIPLTRNYKLYLLHDFLIQFAVIAMFIGIFIQMIFEEKNVTES